MGTEQPWGHRCLVLLLPVLAMWREWSWVKPTKAKNSHIPINLIKFFTDQSFVKLVSSYLIVF